MFLMQPLTPHDFVQDGRKPVNADNRTLNGYVREIPKYKLCPLGHLAVLYVLFSFCYWPRTTGFFVIPHGTRGGARGTKEGLPLLPRPSGPSLVLSDAPASFRPLLRPPRSYLVSPVPPSSFWPLPRPPRSSGVLILSPSVVPPEVGGMRENLENEGGAGGTREELGDEGVAGAMKKGLRRRQKRGRRGKEGNRGRRRTGEMREGLGDEGEAWGTRVGKKERGRGWKNEVGAGRSGWGNWDAGRTRTRGGLGTREWLLSSAMVHRLQVSLESVMANVGHRG